MSMAKYNGATPPARTHQCEEEEGQRSKLDKSDGVDGVWGRLVKLKGSNVVVGGV